MIKNRLMVYGSLTFLVLFWCYLVFHETDWEKEKKANYENGDFEVAHNILTKLQDYVLKKKKLESNHQIKKEKKSHWFKDDEIVVDSVSLLDHEQYIQGLQDKGRLYLAALDYVYNAEIAFINEYTSPLKTWGLEYDGRGNLGNSTIYWNTNGRVVVNGVLYSKEGNIGGLNLSNYSLFTISESDNSIYNPLVIST